MTTRTIVKVVACISLVLMTISMVNAAPLTVCNMDKTQDYALSHGMRVLVVSTDASFDADHCQVYAASMTNDGEYLHLYDVKTGYDIYKDLNSYARYFHVFTQKIDPASELSDDWLNSCHSWQYDNVDDLVGA